MPGRTRSYYNSHVSITLYPDNTYKYSRRYPDIEDTQKGTYITIADTIILSDTNMTGKTPVFYKHNNYLISKDYPDSLQWLRMQINARLIN